MVSSTSKTSEGRGTIMIAKIVMTKITTPKSLLPNTKFIEVPIFCLVVSFFAMFILIFEYIF